MCFYFILFHFDFFCLFVWLRKNCELSIIRIYVGCTSHTLLLRGCKRDYVQIFKKTTMPIDNFATSCSKSWLSLWYIRDSYKKKKTKMQSREGSSPPIVSILAPDLTKKRQGVNPWLLLYVYVLHTGYSKIGLLLAGQLHAQRQLVLLYQALFGQAWSETGYKPHIHARRTVLRVLDGQQQRNKAPEYQHSELRGREVSILVMFSLYVEYIKKRITWCDFVDFALVNYLSVHAYHHFYIYDLSQTYFWILTIYVKGHVATIILSVYIRWHT